MKKQFIRYHYHWTRLVAMTNFSSSSTAGRMSHGLSQSLVLSDSSSFRNAKKCAATDTI
jgi:hypothetical protein